MPEPVITLEVEFTAGVWTPISAYLRSGETKRGKSRAVDKLTPGRASFNMANNLRTFDPEYSGNISPGNLVPDKAIRSTVTYNAVTYPLFYGQIDRIIQRYNGPKDAEATLECSDGLARLAMDELGSPWEVTMAKHSPRAWYRLDEVAGAVAAERMRGLTGGFAGVPDLGQTSLVGGQGNAVKFNVTSDFLVMPPGAMPTVAPWQASVMLDIPAAPPVGSKCYLIFDGRFPRGLTVWIDDTGKLNAQIWQDNGAFYYVRSGGLFGSSLVGFGPVLCSVQAHTSAPFITLYNGGIDITDSATVINSGFTNADLVSSHYGLGAPNVPYTVDEFFTLDANMTFTDLQELTNAAEGWAVDWMPDRLDKVLDAANWPNALRQVVTPWNGYAWYDALLRGTELQTSALAHLEALAASAEARLFVKRDGTLRIIGRREYTGATVYVTPQAVFGDGAGEIPYTEVGDYSLDMATVENVVRRRFQFADTPEYIIEATDRASLAAGQRRRAGDVIESEYMEPAFEFELAQLRASKLARPVPYVEGLKVSPRKNPDVIFPVVLGRELGDRVTWKRHPQGVGTAISKDTLIEGVAHKFGPKFWETTLFIDAIDATNYFRFNATTWDSPDWRFFA